jgi:hypothetical protein
MFGTAKVMSYEYILAAREKREAKERSRAGWTHRNQKCRALPDALTSKEKRSRVTEKTKSEQEIVAWGLTKYCSVLQLDCQIDCSTLKQSRKQ